MSPTSPRVTPWPLPFRLIQHPSHLQAVPEPLTPHPHGNCQSLPPPKQTWSTTPSLPSKAVCSLGLSPLPCGLAPAWLVQGVLSSTPILHPRGPCISATARRQRRPDHGGLETSAHSSFTQERCPALPLPHQTPKGDGKKVGRWGDAQLPPGVTLPWEQGPGRSGHV